MILSNITTTAKYIDEYFQQLFIDKYSANYDFKKYHSRQF